MEWYEWAPGMAPYIHPTAKIGEEVTVLGYVGAEAEIGKHSLIEGRVQPRAMIGEYCWIAPTGQISSGAILLGNNNVQGRVDPNAVLHVGAGVGLGVIVGIGAHIEPYCFAAANVPDNGLVTSLEAFKVLHYRAPQVCFRYGEAVWVAYYGEVRTPQAWLELLDDYYPDRPNEARDLKTLLRAVLSIHD